MTGFLTKGEDTEAEREAWDGGRVWGDASTKARRAKDGQLRQM